ncbi:MAG: 30S ribosomal protein S1, partial [Muribaculaceae bacterium]|nr:30S ribosomal protein S1 [Muribaculaceae bacterium]
IEFNKDSKRIILSHSRIFEDEQRAERGEATPRKGGKRGGKRAAAPEENNLLSTPIEKTTLGDLEALARLKEELSK